MLRICVLLAGLVLGVMTAGADQYWIAYEGTVYPWEQGWERIVQAGGADLSFEEVPEGDQALVINSLASPSICDSYYKYLPSLPSPGEVFRMDWRLRVDNVVGFADPGIAALLGPSGEVVLEYRADAGIYSLYECYPIAAYTMGKFQWYSVVLGDVDAYTLYIDGEMVHEGPLLGPSDVSYAQWGDLVTGAASLAAWDYVGFGVVRGPQTGDVNCDGTVDFRDINPFVQALADGNGYRDTYPGCWPENADINSDGSVDFGDINPFIELLTS